MEWTGVWAKIDLKTVVGEDEWCIEVAQDHFLCLALIVDVWNIGF